MSTNNFLNHENGIFILHEDNLEDFKEMYADDEFFEDATDEDFYQAMQSNQEEYARNMVSDTLPYEIEAKGYTVHNYTVWGFSVDNKQGKRVADIEMRSGYYTGYQVIVETDPTELGLNSYYGTQEELLEQYTPHHKRLLKVIASQTQALTKVGQFSNGEAVYESK